MTQYIDLFAALAAPFEPHEIKTRSQAGRTFQYVTARSIMNRLDNVLGPEGWWDEFSPQENSVICRLTISLPNGAELTKVDAGGHAGMADAGDDDKSGYSDAFKRAAVKFGIGRYLYRDGVPQFVRDWVGEDASLEPRQAPAPTRPNPSGNHSTSNGNGNGTSQNNTPRSGRGLFAWVKEQEQKHEVALLKYLNTWSKLQEFPGRMIDWSDTQVALAYAEACRKLQSVGVDGATRGHDDLEH